MILSINEQAELFLSVFAAGCAAGIFYDLIEVFRMSVRHSKTVGYIEDMMYWIIVIVLLFLFMLEKNHAEIRLFDIIGFFMGMLVYGFVLSPLVVRLLIMLLKAVRAILRLFLEIILTPLRLLWIPLSIPVIKTAEAAEGCLKKVLHLGGIYAKIKLRRIEDQFRFIGRRKK